MRLIDVMPERADLMDGANHKGAVDAVPLRPGSLEDLYVRHLPESTRLAFLLTRDAASAEGLVYATVLNFGSHRHVPSKPGSGSGHSIPTCV